MSYLDIILSIPLVWGLYKGFTKGLIIQVASLLALVAGVYGALYFSDFAREMLSNNSDVDGKYIPVIAFASTFILIVIAVHFLGKALEKMVNMVALGMLNKALGSIFGFLKTTLILSALVFVFEYIDGQFSIIPKKEKERSLLYGPMGELIPTIAPDAKKMANKTEKILV